MKEENNFKIEERFGLKIKCPSHIHFEEVKREIEKRLKDARANKSYEKTAGHIYYKGVHYRSRGGIFRAPGIILSEKERKRVYIKVYKEFGCVVGEK